MAVVATVAAVGSTAADSTVAVGASTSVAVDSVEEEVDFMAVADSMAVAMEAVAIVNPQ